MKVKFIRSGRKKSSMDLLKMCEELINNISYLMTREIDISAGVVEYI